MNEKPIVLATYQPIDADLSKQDHHYDCFREKLNGKQPVFCIPARSADEFVFRSLLAAPLLPEKLILFETSSYQRFDAVTWNNILLLDRDSDEFKQGFENMFTDVDERYSEYIVSADELENPIGEMILEEAVDQGSMRGGDEFTENMLSMLRDKAHEILLTCGSGHATHGHSEQEVAATMRLTAFEYYLAAFAWKALMEKPITVFDTVPFFPSPTLPNTCRAWEEFAKLRAKIFDSNSGGTHKDYNLMCEALVETIGPARLDLAKRVVDRNDPCPCMSGKKFKKCHGRKPVDIFPFASE